MGRGKGTYRRGKVWWICYAGPDGRTRFESSRSKNFKVAEDLLIQRRRDVQEGKDPIGIRKIANHTFKELAEHYLLWAERQRAFDSKRIMVRQLVNIFGNCLLRRFTTRMVEEYQSKFLKEGKTPSTSNRHLAILKHMFTKATEWEMVDEETLKRVRRVKLFPEYNRRLRYLSAEECVALINACSARLMPIVITALNTGMRKQEILSLQWDKHVDLRHGFILLDHTKNGERREIPINENVRKAFACIPRRIDSPYVFRDADGKRIGDVRKSFASACRRAGIKDFRFHDLRHTFASQLVMAGIDLTTVKELLGHKTLSMTLRYAHLAPAHKVAAIEVLGQTISQNPTLQLLDNRPEITDLGTNALNLLTPEVSSGTMIFPHVRP